MRRLEEERAAQRKCLLIFYRLPLKLENLKAMYSNCIINNPVITHVEGNYNHYHGEIRKYSFVFIC